MDSSASLIDGDSEAECVGRLVTGETGAEEVAEAAFTKCFRELVSVLGKDGDRVQAGELT
jgi:hypothetical protein